MTNYFLTNSCNLQHSLLSYSHPFNGVIIVESISTQAVSFDVGGTLIEPWPSVGAVYAEVAAAHGFDHLPVDQINTQFNRAWKEKVDFQFTEAGWLGIVTLTFADLISADDCVKFFPYLYRRFEDPDVWRIYDDVLPTLDDLAGRGFRLAVVSNWDNRLRTLLKNLKLLSFFETATISGDIGFTKPSPVPFEHTLKKLGLPPSAVVHVGDSTSEDIDGAERAGITGILVRRGQPERPHTLTKLTQLSSLLNESW